MSREHKINGGFTLVELLVVIGVIALLISILLPSLKKARDAAQRTACASNLRQIGIMHADYAAQHKGRLMGNHWFIPHALASTDPTKQQYDLRPILLKYTGDKRIFYCPLDPWISLDRPNSWDVPSGGGYHYSSYAILTNWDGAAETSTPGGNWINGAIEPQHMGTKGGSEVAIGGDRMFNIGFAATAPFVESAHYDVHKRQVLGGHILYLDGHVVWKHVGDVKPRLQAFDWTYFW